jgi:molybdenum cofactor cytidylyltransferase
MESVILAAGKSSRMNQEKALLKFGEKTALHLILEKLIPLSEMIYLVCSENIKIFTEHVMKMQFNNIQVIENKSADKGMFSSVLIGLAKCSCRNPVLIQQIDQPLIDLCVYEKLLGSVDKEHWIFQPCYGENGQIGHPLIIQPDLIRIVLSSAVNDNLRNVIRQYRTKRKLILTEDRKIITSINTPEDYKEQLKVFCDGNTG